MYAGTWHGADGRFIFEITADSPPLVSARKSSGEPMLAPKTAQFVASPNTLGDRAQTRLDKLEVELGTPGLGTTLRLMFAVENTDAEKSPHQWLYVPDDADPAQVRMHPEQGGSYYEAVLGPWDDFVENLDEDEGGWLRPYSVYARR
jgi:hypothetical protein